MKTLIAKRLDFAKSYTDYPQRFRAMRQPD